MTDSLTKNRGWYAAIFAFVVAALAFLANIDGTLSFFGRIFSDDEKQGASPASTSVVGAPPRAADTPGPTRPPSTGEKSKEPEPGPLLIRLAIDSIYSRGKDKAAACTDGDRAHCLAVNNTVSNDLGELTGGCHLSWRLYDTGSARLLEKGATQYCGKSDTIFLEKVDRC